MENELQKICKQKKQKCKKSSNSTLFSWRLATCLPTGSESPHVVKDGVYIFKKNWPNCYFSHCVSSHEFFYFGSLLTDHYSGPVDMNALE